MKSVLTLRLRKEIVTRDETITIIGTWSGEPDEIDEGIDILITTPDARGNNLILTHHEWTELVPAVEEVVRTLQTDARNVRYHLSH